MANAEFAAILDIVFKALQLLVLVGGGAWAALKMGRVIERIEMTLSMQARDIADLKEETKKVGEVLMTIAIQKQQLEIIERRIEELRHGEGFIFPLAARLRNES